MKQWDTFDFAFPHGKHPCVVISPDVRCQNAAFETVNLLGCSSHRTLRPPAAHEFLLDSADGMDWETLCRVDFIWVARKADLKQARQAVSPARRGPLGAKLARWFGF